MSILEIIVVYLLSWWVVLFTVLPWGVKRDVEAEEKGFANSAPLNPSLKKKFLITSLITAVVTAVVYFLIDFEVISFRQMIEGWV